MDIAFDRDVNEVSLFFADGSREELPFASKREIAEALIARIASLPQGERQ